jgi:transposase-like protein
MGSGRFNKVHGEPPSPCAKARVALEALKEIKTIQEIAKEYEVHPAQVAAFLHRLLQRLAFLSADKQDVQAAKIARRWPEAI